MDQTPAIPGTIQAPPTRSWRPARLLSLTVLTLLLLAGPVGAWSALGHRLVGELAQRHRAPQALPQVQGLLADEPDPSLAGVGTWGDDLRNSDPPRFKQTSQWHYSNARGGGCGFAVARDCS